MAERIFSKTGEEIDIGKRLIKVDFQEGSLLVESHQYYPSRTEILLEEIARSFGTELGEAYLNRDNGTKLVRLSRPLVLTHASTGERSLLAMQYTRFSPFYDQDEIVKIYKENASRAGRKSFEMVIKDIQEKIWLGNGGDWPVIREVSDPCFIPNIPLARWRKGFYFAVFRLDSKENLPEEIQPFTIHEEVGFEGKLPDVHITFKREPLFISSYGIGGVRKDLQQPDSLRISFPEIYREHSAAALSARTLHPLNISKVDQKLGIMGDISPTESRERVMAFLQAYLRKMCVGVTL